MPLILLALYLVLKPFYLFPSGLPQVADAFLTLAVAIALVRPSGPLDRGALPIVLWAGLFAVWTAAVNVAWATYRADPEFLVPPLFYLYNFALVFLAFRLYSIHRDRFVRVVMWSTWLAVFVQLALALTLGGGGANRGMLFFNNPNQLGYWALLSGSIFFVCTLRAPVGLRWQIPFSLAVLYLVALSLSKAALIALAVLFVLAVVRRPERLAPAMLAALVVVTLMGETALYERVRARIAGLGDQADDNLVTRGYDRLWKHPEHLVLGAGEGGYERFRRWDDAEFHSTPGTLVFSYGVVGAGLFGAFLLGLGRRVGAYGLAFLVPSFLYGVTHQGLRFSTLWLLVAMLGTVRPAPREPLPQAIRLGQTAPREAMASRGAS